MRLRAGLGLFVLIFGSSLARAQPEGHHWRRPGGPEGAAPAVAQATHAEAKPDRAEKEAGPFVPRSTVRSRRRAPRPAPSG